MSRSDSSLSLAVLCGGPSLERGISLNSARSVMDHVSSAAVHVTPFYVDPYLNFYELAPAQIYSNTPSDFDFKLAQTHTRMTEDMLCARLKEFDLVFPAIHGAFGEDGTVQELLEDYGIPFAGSPSLCCRKMFNKDRAAFLLRRAGFETLPAITLRAGNPHNAAMVADFFATHNLTRAIVKPSAGGSSIGVFSVHTPEEACDKLDHHIFGKNIDSSGLLEPFCQGREFTIMVLENDQGDPVALIPTEIAMSYEGGAIFDFRRKYLPTNMVAYHCPPRFDATQISSIQTQAEAIFKLLGMRDFARLDGWVMDDGRIIFSDFNPISGMEQNSFMFQQGARIGLTHADMIRHVVATACRRYGVALPDIAPVPAERPQVRVLFGGTSAERQVSLMSGTNVWLKLMKSGAYHASPYFMDERARIWNIPYMFCLFHTVEEIAHSCAQAGAMIARLGELAPPVRARLGLAPDIHFTVPQAQSLDDFIAAAKVENAFVFLGLHGGIGEDGTVQDKLDQAGVLYNGSGAAASRLCMNKDATGLAITRAAIAHVSSAPKRAVRIPDDFEGFNTDAFRTFWDTLTHDLKTTSFIIKPQNDGCSAGVIRLRSSSDLATYVRLVRDHAPHIPAGSFTGQNDIVEMSRSGDGCYLIESYIETDRIRVAGTHLTHHPVSGWVELTIGVLAQAGAGVYHAFHPSITVAEGDMLSLEEKFQGGTGINITPPPESIVGTTQCVHIRRALERVAHALGIDNYARIDLFFNRTTDDIIIIEANSLPGLTPATVIYHQALAETPPLFPADFLETLIRLKRGECDLE